MDFLLPDLARALARVFPHVGPYAPLRVLGSGFGSLAVQTPTGLVLRVARTAQAGAQYAREAAALPVLAAYLPVAVPRPLLYMPAGQGFPFGVIGYAGLPGETLEMEQARGMAGPLAKQVAVVLLALQSIPVAALPWQDDFSARVERWRRLRQVCLPVLRGALRAAEYHSMVDWWDALLADARMRRYAPVVQHGDLWFGNLLVEGQQVSGVIDFQEVDTGDPAQDFCPQLYLGERFLRRVMDSFQAAGGSFDLDFEARLARLWGLREFGGLAYAIEHQDRLEWEDALEKLRKGPILSRAGLDGWG